MRLLYRPRSFRNRQWQPPDSPDPPFVDMDIGIGRLDAAWTCDEGLFHIKVHISAPSQPRSPTSLTPVKMQSSLILGIILAAEVTSCGASVVWRFDGCGDAPRITVNNRLLMKCRSQPREDEDQIFKFDIWGNPTD